MLTLLHGHELAADIPGTDPLRGDNFLADWAARRMKYVTTGFGPCRAVAVADDANSILAVVVYHAWSEECLTTQVSIAAASPGWARRGVIRGILSIPFDQYGCRKVWSLIPHDNAASRKLCAGLGFRPEGTMRHQFARGVHGAFYGMLDSEFYTSPWTTRPAVRAAAMAKKSVPQRMVPHGKEIRSVAARAA